MKCLAPITVENPQFKGVDRFNVVRCGKCEGCVKTTIMDWSFRLQQEAKRTLNVHFVTLTYDPKHVPLTTSNLATLSKGDVQKYIKRVRKRNPQPIKYMAVGEYGSTSLRPHYHLILFGVVTKKIITSAWSINKEVIGNVHIGNDVKSGAIPYTMKYISKQGLVPAFKQDDRIPEFRLMSNKLGQCYLTPSIERWHMADFPNRQYVHTDTGHRMALPRYYREQLIQKYNYDRKLLIQEEIPYGVGMISKNETRSFNSIIENNRTQLENWEKKRRQKKSDKI